MRRKILYTGLTAALVICVALLVHQMRQPPATGQISPVEAPESRDKPHAGNPSITGESNEDYVEQSHPLSGGQAQVPRSSEQGASAGGMKKASALKPGGKLEPAAELEIDGKKFRLIGKHDINAADIKLKREGNSVTATFPIPEETEKKEGKDTGGRKGE
jgi:hypothetical protein